MIGFIKIKEKGEDISMLKNLVFDFGNVLVLCNSEVQMRECTSSEEEAMALHEAIWGDRFWRNTGLGLASSKDAIDHMCEQHPEMADQIRTFLLKRSDAMRIPAETDACLRKLQKAGYNLYYISNTNDIDYDTIMKNHPILHEFNGGLASHLVHLRKPDHRIFQLLLDRYGLKAEECLFVDDLEANTAAAAELGYHPLTLTTGAATLETALRTIPEISEQLG